MLERSSFYFLILLVTTSTDANSMEYGPSILSLVRPTSTTLLPTTPGLSFLSSYEHEPIRYVQRFLRLENFPNHATVLPLTDGRSWIKSEKIREILGRESLHNAVPFMVVPPPDHGIMVVIQELQIPAINTFNKSLMVIDDNGNILECFSKFVFRIEGKSPVQVCGRTNEQDKFRPGALNGVGPRSFVVPIGKSITVSFIYRDEEIDKSASLSRQVPFYDVGYIFQASIAFTAYSACPNGPPYYNENNVKLWPCDIPINNQSPVGACINEKSFCNGVINCGMHDSQEFAVDERFCKPLNKTNEFARGKGITLNVSNLEKAIRERIINSERPYGYTEVQWGRPLPQIPGKGSGSTYPTDSAAKDQTSHPAFVALVILISIICVLIIGLIFRYCCKTCVGRVDPFGDSSNPEAVARFRENLSNRNDLAGGRVNGGYGISIDSLFKPVDDLPPSYDDLFPQSPESDVRFKIQDNIISSSQSSSNLTGIVFTRQASQNPNQSSVDIPPSPPIYTIPIVAQQLQSTSHAFVERTASGASANASESNLEHCIINPAFVRVEVLPGPNGFDHDLEGRRSSDQSISTDIEMRRTSESNNAMISYNPL